MFKSSRTLFNTPTQTATGAGTVAASTAALKLDVEALKKRIKAEDVSVLSVLAEQSEIVPNRVAMLPLISPTVAWVKKKSMLGSKERELTLAFIGNLAKGEREKDRYSDLQIQLFPMAMEFLVSELRDEAADSKCKEMAIEDIRRMGRNYSLKPRIFESQDFMPVLFTTIKQEVPYIVLDTCLVLITTLATDAAVAEGLVVHFKQQLYSTLRTLLQNEKKEYMSHAVRLTQNLSQHDVSKSVLSTDVYLIDGLALLSKNEKVDNDIVMQALMSLSNLIGDDESKVDVLQGSHNGLLKLVHLLENVLNGKEAHFTLETVLRPLRRLCPPDQNRRTMAPKLTPLMPLVLEHCLKVQDRNACELCFGILSQLSFDKENLELLRNDERIKAALQQIDTYTMSEDTQQNAKWVRVARSAGVFRFNLTKKEEAQRRVSMTKIGSFSNLARSSFVKADNTLTDGFGEQQQIKLMISYQWKYQEIAKMLAMLLKQQGPNIAVWIDIQKMKADVMESMSNAVSSSDYILMLISDSYKNSSACKCEAMYAFELNKPMIPLVVEKGYTAAGWLGALIAGKLRYDCSDPTRVPDEIPRVLGEIHPGMVISVSNSKDPRRSGLPAIVGPKTIEEVGKWLTNNGFDQYADKFKAEGIDGECLRVIREDFVVFSQDLQGLFGMDFKTRVLFKKALNTLAS